MWGGAHTAQPHLFTWVTAKKSSSLAVGCDLGGNYRQPGVMFAGDFLGGLGGTIFFLFIEFIGVTLVNKIIRFRCTVSQHIICTLQCGFATPGFHPSPPPPTPTTHTFLSAELRT